MSNRHQRPEVKPLEEIELRNLSPEERAAMARQEIILTLKRFNCAMTPYRDLEKENAEKTSRSLALRFLSLFVKEFRQREIYSINISGLPYPESDDKPQ